jgi:hypothetical protein
MTTTTPEKLSVDQLMAEFEAKVVAHPILKQVRSELLEQIHAPCADRKEARAKQLESIVRKTTIAIHNAGNYPSQCKVRLALPSSIDMRDPPANKAWKQTLVELGLSMDHEHPTTES